MAPMMVNVVSEAHKLCMCVQVFNVCAVSLMSCQCVLSAIDHDQMDI